MLENLMLGFLLILLACIAITYQNVESTPDRATRRLSDSINIYSASVLLWPALILIFVGLEPFVKPLSCIVIFLVLLIFRYEITALSSYCGPVNDIETYDAVFERNIQVCSVAFAVSTLLFSQGNQDLSTKVAPLVLLSLLFCTISIVPSILAKRRLGENGQWNAIFKMFTSFAAGLLCISLATCLDMILPLKS